MAVHNMRLRHARASRLRNTAQTITAIARKHFEIFLVIKIIRDYL